MFVPRTPPPRQLALCSAFNSVSREQGTPATAAISNADLAEMTGLSAASVKLGITELVREGVIYRTYTRASGVETKFDTDALQFQLVALMEATS